MQRALLPLLNLIGDVGSFGRALSSLCSTAVTVRYTQQGGGLTDTQRAARQLVRLDAVARFEAGDRNQSSPPLCGCLKDR